MQGLQRQVGTLCSLSTPCSTDGWGSCLEQLQDCNCAHDGLCGHEQCLHQVGCGWQCRCCRARVGFKLQAEVDNAFLLS